MPSLDLGELIKKSDLAARALGGLKTGRFSVEAVERSGRRGRVCIGGWREGCGRNFPGPAAKGATVQNERFIAE